MKHIKNTLFAVAFILQYIMPIVLFGYVIPYFHGEIGAGLTGTGIIAFCLISIIIYKKVKIFIRANFKGGTREILLSFFPISVWVVLGAGLDRVFSFVTLLVEYWWIAFLFIILGRVCKIIAGIITVEESDNGQ